MKSETEIKYKLIQLKRAMNEIQDGTMKNHKSFQIDILEWVLK